MKNAKTIVIVFIAITIVLILLIVPGNQKDESAVTSQQSQQEETQLSTLSAEEIEEMERENDNKKFYVWSDDKGSWEEIAFLGDTDYTYMVMHKGKETENCSGHYKMTGDASLILAYDGEAYEGEIKNDVLYIFDKKYIMMEDSHI